MTNCKTSAQQRTLRTTVQQNINMPRKSRMHEIDEKNAPKTSGKSAPVCAHFGDRSIPALGYPKILFAIQAMAGSIRGFAWLLLLSHVLSCLQVSDAACANSCSGHGRCGSSNQCTCDPDWALAPDCSMRKCPNGVAWTDKAKTANVAHAKAECSNRGVCDYFKGECTCFNGFTGAACQRLRCPSDCSGHGLCYSSATLALQYGPDSPPSVAGDGVGPVYSNWEKDSMSSCLCDMGYTGPDCSQLMCAKNDDPLTTGQGLRTIHIQVGADASTNLPLVGSVRVRLLGDAAEFSAVAVADAAHEQACAQAFQSMRTVLTATCTITSVDPVTAGAIYTVTFKEWVHLGGENNLLYHDGNPPLTSFSCDLTKVTSLNSPTCAVTDVTATNIIEHVYCSNRGLCDFTTGHCVCYADFKGLDCNQPSNVPDSIDDNDGFIINPLGLTYTGTVLHLKTAKGSQADFYFMKISSSTLPILTMNGMGDTKLLNGNLQLSTGSLTITTIAQTSTAADIANTHATFTGTALKIRTSRASSNAFKLLEAMTGDITTVVEIRGDGLTTIYTGGLYVVTGGGTISHTLDGPSLTVTNSYNFFTNSLLKLSTSRASRFPTATDFVLIEATANNVPAFTVEASGRTTIADGGLVVNGLGGAQISNSDPAASALIVSATGTNFAGDAVAVKTFSNVAHNMLKVTTKVGISPAIDLFTISNSGLTTITQGGLHVVTGGATIDTGGLHVGYGGETIDFGGLRVKDGGGTIELGGLNVIDGGGKIASKSAVSDILAIEATSFH
ncbi:EGF-like domain [Phytophthora infestans]|uniref:EGF-like domain n=1 Tax=Phytophthora infestans TaxID=4787 RepID=A0A8S9UIX4_PHYIN|nr:EGF-like domain [Phytophthora infestans]